MADSIRTRQYLYSLGRLKDKGQPGVVKMKGIP